MQIDGSTLERPAPPLNELLGAGLEAGPDEVALVSAERALTWRELDEESARLAGGYRGLGLEAGDRLASLMPNRIDLVVHYLACFRAGLVAAPLNYRYTAREIDHALEVSGARALLAHVERAEDVAASAPSPIATPNRCRAATTNPTSTTEAGATSSRRCWPPSRCRRVPSPPAPMHPRRSSSPPAAPVRPRASPTATRRCAG
jgi:acyl-CoA synthetase (AMP-forming)/AMP-acid ligase II